MSQLSLVSPSGADKQRSIFVEFFEVFLDSKTKSTREAYGRDFALFASYLGYNQKDCIEQLLSNGSARANLLVARWINHLRSSGLSSCTLNRRLSTIQSIIRTANAYGISDVQLNIRREPSRQIRDTKGPSIERVRLMITRLEQDRSPAGMRKNCLFQLLFSVALRRQEVAGLRREWLDLEEGVLRVAGCKGMRGKEVSLCLPQPAISALLSYVQEVRGDEPGFLFPGRDASRSISPSTIYRFVRQLGEELGFRCWPHALRHSAITLACEEAAREGLDLSYVQAFSRHADARSLMVYRDQVQDAQSRVSQLVASRL